VIKVSALILIALLVNLQANITKEQQQKLNRAVVTEKNDILVIEEYNKVIFTEPVLFAKKEVSEIYIKTYATMKKGTIHKEQFIAISSAISDQMIQSVLFSPQYFEKMKSSEMLVSKPMQTADLNVEIEVTKEGLKTKLYSKDQTMEHFVPFDEMFLSKMR
jgi:hypothetical protein